MKDIVNHLEYTKLFLIISVGMIALVYLTHLIFNRHKKIKYLPGFLSIIIGIYGLVTIDTKIIFLDDIRNLTIFIIGTAVGFLGLAVALIIGVFNKNKKKKVKRVKKIKKSAES